MSDKAEICARPGCGLKRAAHVLEDREDEGWGNHAFVSQKAVAVGEKRARRCEALNDDGKRCAKRYTGWVQRDESGRERLLCGGHKSKSHLQFCNR